MNVVLNESGEQIYVSIDGELTIYGVAESKPLLLKALDTGLPIDIDLAAVTEIDTAGLQLMLMLKREAQRRQKQLVFSRHSTAVREVVELLNLVGVLGDPLLIPNNGATPERDCL